MSDAAPLLPLSPPPSDEAAPGPEPAATPPSRDAAPADSRITADPSSWPKAGSCWVYGLEAGDGEEYLARFDCPVDPEDLRDELGGGRYLLMFKGPDGTIRGKPRFTIGGVNVRAAARQALGVPARAKGTARELLEALHAAKVQPAAAPVAAGPDPLLMKILEQQAEQQRMLMELIKSREAPSPSPRDKVTETLFEAFAQRVLAGEKPISAPSEMDRMLEFSEKLDKLRGGGELTQVLGLVSQWLPKPGQERAPAGGGSKQQKAAVTRTAPAAGPASPAAAPAEAAPVQVASTTPAAAAAPVEPAAGQVEGSPVQAPEPAGSVEPDTSVEDAQGYVVLAALRDGCLAAESGEDDESLAARAHRCAGLAELLVPEEHMRGIRTGGPVAAMFLHGMVKQAFPDVEVDGERSRAYMARVVGLVQRGQKMEAPSTG